MRKLILAGLISMFVWASTQPAWAAPDSELWDRWLAHDETSIVRLHHGTWDQLLKRYISVERDGINKVSYRWFYPDDKRALSDYLEYLSQVRVSALSRAEQRAYWINLYNALTVQVVLKARVTTSIRDVDISPNVFADGPWGKELITVEDTPLTLDDIEHRILRPIWQDPRIHYALNCAALGCPNLWPLALTRDNAELYLSEGARAFVNHARGVTVRGTTAHVSAIYKWFSEDFGGSDDALLQHLKTYAVGETVTALNGVGSIGYQPYDWTLNAAYVSRPQPRQTHSTKGS